jgi:hypothetical protein
MTVTTVRLPKPPIDYPRPPLVCDHAQLFVEARYADDEPYGGDQDDEDDELRE